jgi:hypothetical protein
LANTISVYLSSATLGSTYQGGIFIDSMTTDLLASVKNAAFAYYVKDTDGNYTGDMSFNGNYYTELDSALIAVSEISVTNAPFGTKTVSGSELEFTVVPEPSTWAMLTGGLGMLLGFQRMRRRAFSETPKAHSDNSFSL